MSPRPEPPAAVYLKPGEVHIAQTPTVVTTVLGSCVSVTMFAPAAGIGAICHGLLPACREKRSCDGSCTEGFKYVECSIQRMAERFKKLGIPPHEIEVKLFGGADMISAKGRGNATNVGRQNIDIALQALEGEGLTLATYDVGGNGGRKIHFYTHTGEVLLKRLQQADLPDAAS